MKLLINLLLSVAMLALFLWLVWPDAHTRAELRTALATLRFATFAPYLAIYLGVMVIVHFTRAWRWNNLLAPLGLRLPAGPLLAISSVGFLAILAIPARLGEFVRPGLLRSRNAITTAQALGTVAVERIVDGLIVSLLVFAAFFAAHGPSSPGWMMPTAYFAIGIFGAALVFLIFALRAPLPTIRFFLKLSLIPTIHPPAARFIERKLLELIDGCTALRDKRNLLEFMAWSIVYWTANGASVWVLAQAFGLPLSPIGAFATMGLVAVGISLPNSPGLVGQFQWFTMLGLQVYLGTAVKAGGAFYATALAFAIIQHILQVIWYTAMGIIAMATPWVSFADLRRARKAVAEPVAALPYAGRDFAE